MKSSVRRPIQAVMLVLVVVTFTGCQGWFAPRRGDVVTRIVVDRQVWSQQADASISQTLDVDILTGKVALTDADGKVHESQISIETADIILDALSTRKWQRTNARPVVGSSKAGQYRMLVYNDERQYPRPAMWLWPSSKQPPQPLVQISDTFDYVSRKVHPLSTSVNLVK